MDTHSNPWVLSYDMNISITATGLLANISEVRSYPRDFLVAFPIVANEQHFGNALEMHCYLRVWI